MVLGIRRAVVIQPSYIELVGYGPGSIINSFGKTGDPDDVTRHCQWSIYCFAAHRFGGGRGANK